MADVIKFKSQSLMTQTFLFTCCQSLRILKDASLITSVNLTFGGLVITALLVGIDEWKNRSTRLMRALRWRRTDGGCGGGGMAAIDRNAVRDIYVSAAAVVCRHWHTAQHPKCHTCIFPTSTTVLAGVQVKVSSSKIKTHSKMNVTY